MHAPEYLRGTQQYRGVTVVAACMHLPGCTARPGKAGQLLNRQRIHICAQTKPRPALAPSQGANYTGSRDAAMHLEAPLFQALGHQPAGRKLAEAEFRMLMDGMPP